MTQVRPYGKAKTLLKEALEDAVTAPISQRPAYPSPWVSKRLGFLASLKTRSYRDGMLVLLAMAVCADAHLDVTERPPGLRTLAQYLYDEVYLPLYIRGTKDAFANIGKNTKSLIRGNVEEWDEMVKWISATTTTKEDLKKAFHHLAWLVGRTAKKPDGWQELEPGALTFQKMASLFDDLLSRKSRGAYQQFSFAALLRAARELESGRSLLVLTKRIDASDATSGVLGDVQVWDRDRLLESYEVTANSWETKLSQAIDILRTGKIDHVVIVAAASGVTAEDLEERIPPGHDIAVVDVGSEVRSQVARLPRKIRALALRYLHEYLENEHSRPELLDGYLEALQAHGLDELDEPGESAG